MRLSISEGLVTLKHSANKKRFTDLKGIASWNFLCWERALEKGVKE